MTDSDTDFDGPALASLRGSDAPPSARAVAARPFGYLGLAAVWLGITAAIVFLLSSVPLAIDAQGPLSQSPAITRLTDDNEWAVFIVVMPVVALLFGALIVLLLQASLSLTVLSLVAFTRALRPSFAGERLTSTRWTGEAIGSVKSGVAPVSYAPVKNMAAMSLIPVRRTRFSAFFTAGMLFAFAPSLRVIIESTWLGLAYVLTFGWIQWPVSAPLAVVWTIVSVGLTVTGVWRVARARRLDRARWATQPT